MRATAHGHPAPNKTMKSQKDRIKAHLLSGKSISPLEALNLYGCFRLGARIWDLRHEGMEIEEVGDKQYAVYRLKSTAPVQPIKLPNPFPEKPKVEAQPGQLF